MSLCFGAGLGLRCETLEGTRVRKRAILSRSDDHPPPTPKSTHHSFPRDLLQDIQPPSGTSLWVFSSPRCQHVLGFHSFIHSLFNQYLLSTNCVPRCFIHGVKVQARSCVNPTSTAGSAHQFFRVSLFHFLKTDFFFASGLCSSPLSQFPWVGKKYFCLFLFSLLWMMPRVRLDTAGRTGSRVVVICEVVLSMKSPQAVTPPPGSTPHVGAWLVYSE